MLKRLEIKNYAIIESAKIDFATGLTAITGETGAGKSILLGALGLVLGKRADTTVLHNNGGKCIVEATFELKESRWKNFFENEQLDFEVETVIRREINTSGKSRAFINDTPCKLHLLEGLSAQLIQIHSQHETLDLANSSFQLLVLDSLADNSSLLNQYRQKHQTYLAITSKLKDALTAREQAIKEKDYIEYQFNELESAGLDDIDVPSLELRQKELEHAEEIQKNLNEADNLLNNGNSSISDLLNHVESQLRGISSFYSPIESLIERIEQASIEINDISNEIQLLASNVSPDNKELELIGDQLSVVYNLYRKHSCNDIDALKLIWKDYEEKLNDIIHGDDIIKELEIEAKQSEKVLIELSEELNKKRKKVIPHLQKEVLKLLSKVGMEGAELQVDLQIDDQLRTTGRNSIQFNFSANPGSTPKELHKVASGGELSRLMLCIKSLLAGSINLPTLLFDEIDAGVSGKVAAKVGEIMKTLAEKHQVIVITHLPQIAGNGHEHLLVEKTIQAKTTITSIRPLNKDERIAELATMLSGTSTESAAIENAKLLLNHD